MKSELDGLTNSEKKNKYWEIVREYDCRTMNTREEHVEYFTGTYNEMLKRCDELDTDSGTCASYVIDPISKERM